MEQKNMPWSEKFFRKNLDASKKGSEEQQDDMAGFVGQNAQMLGELGDIVGGRRKQKENPHHPVKDLVDKAVTNTDEIVKLRQEIEGKKK